MSDNQDFDNLATWANARTVTVEGTKVPEFLQGYLTCDVTNLDPGEVKPTVLCNLKGRVVANGWTYRDRDTPDELVRIVVHQSLADRVVEFLKPYAQFSRCKLSIENDPVMIRENLPEGDIAQTWSLVPSQPVPDKAAMADVSTEVERALVETSHPWLSSECSELFLPQMLGLHEVGAIDFQKGCYLGQEVVARAQFRGSVKRKLIKSNWQGSAPVIGQKIDATGVTVMVAHDPESSESGVLLSVN